MWMTCFDNASIWRQCLITGLDYWTVFFFCFCEYHFTTHMRSVGTLTLKLSYRRLNMSGTSVSPIVVGDTDTDSSDNDVPQMQQGLTLFIFDVYTVFIPHTVTSRG